MTDRTGLGRRGRIHDAAGDPLDGLVNLFDIGIVLAIAFLVAGLGFTGSHHARSRPRRTPATRHAQTLPSPANAPPASGHGQPVGTVYRLAGGQLVYVQRPVSPVR